MIDAGAKTLTKDAPAYLPGFAAIPELSAVVDRVSDYHGVCETPEGGPLPDVGQVVLAVPNHICPVVDLFGTFLVAREGEIVDTWRVDARGRSG